MAGGGCYSNDWRKGFSPLENSVTSCYSSWDEDKDEKTCQEFVLSELQRLTNEAVQHHPDSIQPCKVTGDCDKQQYENQIERAEEFIVENGKTNTQIQAPNKKLGELHKTNIRVEESERVVYWMVGISIMLFPAIKVRGAFPMGFRRCQR